jgi:parallel beta-helix repeat protein
MTTYYVNPKATGAHNLNPGTNPRRPFTTLARANALAISGDTVIVYPNTYYEEVQINVSNVTWLGSDPGVIIDCSDPVSLTWTLDSGTRWVANYPATPAVFNMVVDGVAFVRGGLNTSASMVVYGYDPVTKLVSNAFWQDRVNNKLYLDLGGANPNSSNIRIGIRPTAFQLDTLTNCRIEGFITKASSGYGLQIKGGSGHIISLCEFWGHAAGGLRLEAPSPSLFNPTSAGAGGTLPAGTHYYKVSAVVGGVETIASPEQSRTVVANEKVGLQWNNVVGATAYYLYGRTHNGETRMATIAPPVSSFILPSYTDDGSATPDGVNQPPIVSTVTTTGNVCRDNNVWQIGSHGIYIYGASGNTIWNNRCHHNAYHGIAVLYNSNNNLIEANRCWSNSQYNLRIASGIQLDFFGIGTTGSLGNIIQRNMLHHNQDSGLSVWNGSNNTLVRGNVVYNNGDHGIDISGNTLNASVTNNIVVGSVTAGINVEGTTPYGSTGSRICNNIAVDNGVQSPRTSGNYRVDAPSINDVFMDWNLTYLTIPAASQTVGSNCEITWGSGLLSLTQYMTLAAFQTAVPTQMQNAIGGNPLFVNSTRDDFHLSNSSPARHAGTESVTGYLPYDFDGVLHSSPQPNMGAYV